MQYIGSRYVPKFMGTYEPTQIYEALSVVDNGLGTSYISRKITPAGTPLTDNTYWAVYGASSGAIINLQNQIGDLSDLNTTDKDNLVDAVNEVDSDIQILNNKTNSFVTPEMYGAVGDGTSDDTLALQAALRSGYDVLMAHTYKITSTIYCDVECNIICNGSVIAIGDFDAFVIGGAEQLGSRGWFTKKTIKLIVEKDTPDWSSVHTGITLKNVMSAELSLYVANFNTGILVLGDAFGVAWNLFKEPQAFNCKYGIVLQEANSGWCNQNTFVGGKISWEHTYASAHADSSAPCIGLIVTGNENSFYNTSVDGQGSDQSDYDIYRGISSDGRWNHYDHIRLERVGSIVFSGVWDYINEPYMFVEYTTVTRTNANSVIINNIRTHEIITEGAETLKIQTTASTASLIAGYNSGGTKVLDINQRGNINTLGWAKLAYKTCVLGSTSNPDTYDDDLDEQCSYFIRNSNASPGVGAIIGNYHRTDYASQFHFALNGHIYSRTKDSNGWGAWTQLV